MADIFESNVQSESALEVLVGEGKKFSDAEALARAKIEADRTVADRNRELEEHRAEMARLREEVLALKNQPREPVTAPEPPKEADRPVEDGQLDLASRIREEMRQAQKEDVQNQNVLQVRSKLIEVYGTQEKAQQVLSNKAAELGLPVEFLNSVAAQSPQAFYQTIGLTEQTSQAPVAVRGDVNAAVVATQSSAPKTGTYKAYQEMMKSDPKRYWTADVQNRMFEDRKRLGEQFYA